MSTTTFVEAHSADPYIRELHRKAVRLLNDPTLDRQQREFHVRRLQAALLEYQAINKAVNKAKEGGTVAEVRAIFDRAAAIDDMSSISGKDLDVTKEGDKTVVAFAYTREIHMAGPAFLLLKYNGRSK